MQITQVLLSIVYGIVEGITEWLPVSSTGHLILLKAFLPLESSTQFWDMFEVVIQLGAIFAVVLVFFKDIWPFGLNNRKTNLIQTNNKVFLNKFVFKWDVFVLWLKIITACVPAIIYGVLFDDKVSEIFSQTIGKTAIQIEVVVVIAMLILVGIAFILIENANKNKTPLINNVHDITYKLSLLIGVFQLIAAALPGTSRSGATILGALMIGIARPAAASFTFYLAIPVMFGASALKGLKFITSGVGITQTEIAVLITGSLVAFAVSIVIIKFLMKYIKRHDFKVFGWYRIALGLLLVLYFVLTSIR